MNESDSDDLEVRETYRAASEFAPSVTITDETFFEHGWQPLTICVLQAIWFMPPAESFGVATLVDWFRTLGWKSANGKPLGPDAIRRELALIRKSGYIRAARIQGEGGRMVGIEYVVSKRRSAEPQDKSWIPVRSMDDGNRRSDHVPPMTTHGGSPHMANDGNRRSDHVPPMTTHGGSPHMADRASLQVAPCASNEAPPPHPPEEEVTTSPNPLRPAAREEAGSFAQEDIAAANRLLQMLPMPWTAGRKPAQRLAPKILEAMSDQGWPGIRSLTETDRCLLVAELTLNPDGVHNYESVLPKRIDHLRLYEVVAAGVPANPTPQPPSAAAVFQDDPEYKPVPPPPAVLALLQSLGKPNV